MCQGNHNSSERQYLVGYSSKTLYYLTRQLKVTQVTLHYKNDFLF